jgi:coenzyme F420-0:L-glutamate ligase/coenzyme F420-1:gamma-L-glutamate ligase
LDPDASARAIRERLESLAAKTLAVLIIDTLGRPFREGVMGMVIGVAGMEPLVDVRGQTDLYGYVMEHTIINRADEVAAAASMLMGQTSERLPVVIVRGASYRPGTGSAHDILREPGKDMFRPKGYVWPGKAS